MRIVVNTRHLIKNKLEGVGFFTEQICTRLAALHPNFEFIFCVDQMTYEKNELPENVIVEKLWPPARHPYLYYLWFEHALPKIFKKYQPALFYSTEGFCSLSSRAPRTVITVHDLAYLHFPHFQRKRDLDYYRKYQPKFMAKSDQIITVSQFSKNDIIHQFNKKEADVCVVYNGPKTFQKTVQPNNHLDEKWPTDQPFFLYVGSLHPRKNIINLMKGFEVFKSKHDNHAQLLIAGRNAWLSKEMEQAYESNQYKDNIHFLGYITNEQMLGLFSKALALVYVSLFEGFGMPVLDAMQFGLPVITSKNTSMEEILDGLGYLADPKDQHDIAQQMSQVFLYPEQAKETARKAKEYSEQKYSWEQSARVLSDFCFQ